MSDLLVVVDDIAQVVATRVMRLAHAHRVVGEVDIAVVAEELRHGCGRGVWVCRSAFPVVMRLSYSARREDGAFVESVVEGVAEGAVEDVVVEVNLMLVFKIAVEVEVEARRSSPRFEARASNAYCLLSLSRVCPTTASQLQSTTHL